MRFTVVTMTRGDAHKIAEWVDHHVALGFEDFQVVLDGDVDGTEEVLRGLETPATITVHRRDEVGEYFDGWAPEDRRERVLAWRAQHAAELESGAVRGVDPLAWRQHLHFPDVLAPYNSGQRGKGWLALIDVDEFFVLAPASVQELVVSRSEPRVRFLSFNVDTSGYDASRPVLAQHSMRWSHADLLAHPDQRWGKRVKSLVRNRAAVLNATVHKVSRGRHEVLDPEVGRIHHFKMPPGGLDVPYTVDDPIRARG